MLTWEMEHARRAALRVTRLASIESVASRLPRLMACCSVVKFDLSGRGISSEGFKILARVLGQCPSLATLNLGCNHIGDEGAGSLAWVQGQCCSLVELNLGGNDIGDHGIAMILSCPRLKPVYGFVRKKLLSYRASILIQRTRLTASVRVQRKPDDRRIDSWEKEIQPTNHRVISLPMCVVSLSCTATHTEQPTQNRMNTMRMGRHPSNTAPAVSPFWRCRYPTEENARALSESLLTRGAVHQIGRRSLIIHRLVFLVFLPPRSPTPS